MPSAGEVCRLYRAFLREGAPPQWVDRCIWAQVLLERVIQLQSGVHRFDCSLRCRPQVSKLQRQTVSDALTVRATECSEVFCGVATGSCHQHWRVQ
jgi:hypothetical protein